MRAYVYTPRAAFLAHRFVKQSSLLKLTFDMDELEIELIRKNTRNQLIFCNLLVSRIFNRK